MHVLVIGGKDSSFSSIRDLDIKVTLIQERADLTTAQRDKADNLIVFPTLDPDQVERVAAALHASDPFDAVVSFFESCLLLAARVGNALGVKHNPLRAVELTRDKIAMRALLADEGIPTVRYRACTSAADCAEFLESIDAPVIIKPAGGTGSRGITLATVPADIEQAWLNYSVMADGPAIAEEFVTGREFSVESITRNGIHEIVAITEKQTTGAPGFVECGHSMPAQVDDVTAESLHATVTRLLDAVGHVWGPAHTEIMLTEDGRPVVIESQTRIGGDQIWEMVELTAGVRLAGATVAAMLGIAEPQTAKPRAGGAAIRFFVPTHSRVVAVDGVEAARTLPGVIRVDMRAKPGDVLGGLASSWSRQGYVLAVGTSPANAIATVEEAFDLVRIVTEAGDNLPSAGYAWKPAKNSPYTHRSQPDRDLWRHGRARTPIHSGGKGRLTLCPPNGVKPIRRVRMMQDNVASPDSPPQPRLADLPPLAALKRAYDEDGFVHVPGLFSTSEISRFVQAADALVAEEAHGGVKHAYDASFSQVQLPASKDDALRELTVDPRLALLAGVLSEMPRIRVFLDRILYKQAGGSPTKAHVDAPFLCFEDPRSLACWIALTDTTAENGALSYYVGSHRRPLTDKSLEPDGSISAHDPSLNARLLRSLPARAGDVVFHNAHTIHLAGANNTPETRRAYTIQYMPDGVAFNGDTKNFFADCAPAQGAPLDMPCFPRVL